MPLIYFSTPWLVHFSLKRLLPSYRRANLGWLVGMYWVLALAAWLVRVGAVAAIHIIVATTDTVSSPYSPSTPVEVIGADLHGAGEWPGRDFAAPCNTVLYAPIDGWVEAIGFDSFEGPWGSRNSYIRFTDGVTQVVFMHGRYLPYGGDRVRRQETIIGLEDSIGNSSQCHTHMSVRVNGELVDPLTYFQPTRPTGRRPLKVSYYDPALGGINCDSNCQIMADGGTWSFVDYGRTAACAPLLPLGQKLVIQGVGRVVCRDRGGAIQCTEQYCWIDLMLKHRPGFVGGFIYDWEVER